MVVVEEEEDAWAVFCAPSPEEGLEVETVELTAEWFAGDAELEEEVLEGALEATALLEELGEDVTALLEALFEPNEEELVALAMGVAEEDAVALLELVIVLA